MVKSMKIVLLGPPGSGKSTVAEKISSVFSLYDLYMGDILRKEIQKDTIVGKEVAKYLKKGELVPGNFVSDLVYLLLLNKKKFLLDGYLRTVKQVEYIHEQGIVINCVLYLKLDEKEVVKRLSNRRVCPKCRAQFHLLFFPSKKKGVCDKCGSGLVRRDDDAPEVIKNRFRIYHKETAPLIDFYSRNNVLYTIDASLSPEEVVEEVMLTIGGVFKKK